MFREFEGPHRLQFKPGLWQWHQKRIHKFKLELSMCEEVYNFCDIFPFFSTSIPTLKLPMEFCNTFVGLIFGQMYFWKCVNRIITIINKNKIHTLIYTPRWLFNKIAIICPSKIFQNCKNLFNYNLNNIYII